MQRLWSFPELRFVHACSRGMNPGEVADELNTRYHGGLGVRSPIDVERIKNKKKIFSFETERKGGE